MNTNDLLSGILAELKAQNESLGFGHPPRPRYIYANRQYPDALWYFWDGAKKEYEPIPYHALTGLIEKLDIETKEFKGKTEAKVNLHIKADRRYILQVGYDTIAAKGLLWGLSKLPQNAYSAPITIAVEPGETDQVLFTRIYNPRSGESVYAPYPDNTNWANVVSKAQAKINPAAAPSAGVALPPVPVPTQVSTISKEQMKRLFAISRSAGFIDGAVKLLIGDFEYLSTSDIRIADYERICELAGDESQASIYNDRFRVPIGTW